MREISCGAISELVERLCVEAATVLPDDLCRTILKAREMETSPVGVGILQDIADNFALAQERGVPICQDTGMAVVFLELGQEVHITGGNLRDAVNRGVHNGYLNGALRCSVVHDPLRRVNTGDNTPATLSHKISTELLRDELGFKGLVVTDGLNMGALAKNYKESEIYWRAVDAGADLLLLPSNPDLAITSIKEHISEARIDESVRRILRYKLGTQKKWQLLDESNFASAENQAIVDQVK